MMRKMKPLLAKDEVIPMGISRDMFRTLGTMFTTFIEKPFDDQGVLKFESQEWFMLLEMLKKWKDDGLARLDPHADSMDVWQKGKFAFSLGSHSLVRIGRQVWGTAKIKGANPAQANASAPTDMGAHRLGIRLSGCTRSAVGNRLAVVNPRAGWNHRRALVERRHDVFGATGPSKLD